MLKKLKTKYLLISLSIAQCLNLSSMNLFQNMLNSFQNRSSTQLDPETQAVINDALKTAKESNYKDLIRQINEERQADQLKATNDLIAQIKKQNTILLRLGEYTAFYKSDIVRGSCFALEMLGEHLMYKKIQQTKIDHVFEKIKRDSKNLEKLLEKAEFSKKVNGITLFNIKNTPEIQELMDYVNNKHKLISYNPFKIDLLPHLILNLTKTKILKFIENSFLTKPTPSDFLNPKVIQTYINAYDKDKEGNLQKTKTPFSIVTLLMYFLNPKYLLEDMQASQQENLKKINKFFNLGIPNILFSKSISAIASISAGGIAIKVTDNILTNSWRDYLKLNQTRLLKLLQRYNKEIDSENAEEVKRIEKKLKKFITEGHSKNISYLWLQAKNLSQSRIGLMLSLPVIGALAWKGYNFYKTNIA